MIISELQADKETKFCCHYKHIYEEKIKLS